MAQLTLEQQMADFQSMISEQPEGTIISLTITPSEEGAAPIKKCCKIVDGMFIRIRCDSVDVYIED